MRNRCPAMAIQPSSLVACSRRWLAEDLRKAKQDAGWAEIASADDSGRWKCPQTVDEQPQRLAGGIWITTNL